MPGGSKTFYLFDHFYENPGLKTENLDLDALNVYLSNEAPIIATDLYIRPHGDEVDSGPEEIVAEHGYSAGGTDVVNGYSGTGGTATLVAAANTTGYVEWTATGGTIGPFRYAVLYDWTSGSLIGYWDYGGSITLEDTESFKVDFGASLLTIT